MAMTSFLKHCGSSSGGEAESNSVINSYFHTSCSFNTAKRTSPHFIVCLLIIIIYIIASSTETDKALLGVVLYKTLAVT